MAKFDEYFAEVRYFTNDQWVISGKLPKEEAASLMSKELIDTGVIEEPITSDDLEENRVRFGFAPENVAECQGELCWYSGATGKGSLPVWVYG